MTKLIAVAVVLLIAVSPAYAQCLYNGQLVPAGTEISGLVCQSDGSWL